MKVKIIEPAQVAQRYTLLSEDDKKNLIGGAISCTEYSKTPCYWYIKCGTPPAELSSAYGPAYSDGSTTCSDYFTDKDWCIWR